MERKTPTAPLRTKLCKLLERGHSVEGATGLIGLHRGTFYHWVERGNEARALREHGKKVPANELPYLRFVDAVELARQHGEGWLFEQMLEAPPSVWQKYATGLERRFPDRWRRRASSEYASSPERGRSAAVLTFDPEKLSNDELETMRVLLAKSAPAEE